MGMENGAPIGDDLANLTYFRKKGISYIDNRTKESILIAPSHIEYWEWTFKWLKFTNSFSFIFCSLIFDSKGNKSPLNLLEIYSKKRN